MIFTIPNIISLIRVLLAPIFFYLLIWGGGSSIETACIIYFLGSASDYVDGWYARKFHTQTNLGKFFDPLADKILTTAAFLAFVFMDILVTWMVVIIIIRDFGTTFLRVYAEYTGKHIKTSLMAKWKTFLQMLFIAYILILLLLGESQSHSAHLFNLNYDKIKNFIHSDFTYYLMLILTLLTIWTAIEYILQNKSLFAFNPKNDISKK